MKLKHAIYMCLPRPSVKICLYKFTHVSSEKI